MSVDEAFERPNIHLFLTTFADSFVGQQIIEAAVFLRLNHRVALPVSHHLALLILQLSRLQTTGIQSLITMQLTSELPAGCPILERSRSPRTNPSLVNADDSPPYP
jgi:hypothetical protein